MDKKKGKIAGGSFDTYLNPREIVEFCSKERRTLKMVTSDVGFNNKLVVRDISLCSKGDEEDRAFGENPFLHANIRRGNSILEVLNDEKQVEETLILRKGLKKFFDVYLEYLDVVETSKTASSWLNQNKHFSKLKQLTIDPVAASFTAEPEQNVTVYLLGKANGENAQISYIAKYSAWAVCSKNVCALIQSAKDLNGLDAQRYSFSRLIGETWLSYVDTLEKKDPSLVADLKAYMNGRTFVGEYCGNQDYQHLVKYDAINLHFYAIVENNSVETCIPPEEAYQVFNKFGFKTVEIEKHETKSWGEFNTTLFDLYKRIGSASIEVSGEGAVLYFVQSKPSQRVISLCKLKTLEYRIFRKLREKLKNCLSDKKGASNKWLKKFTKEVDELCEFCSPAQPLDYYFRIAQAAFDFIDSSLGAANKDTIQSKYITFLDMIKKSVIENVNIDAQFFRKNLKEKDSVVSSVSNEPDELKNLHQNSRIILVTPPFYLREAEKNKICQTYRIKNIGDSWKQGHANTKLLAIDNIHLVPRITAEKLNKNNYFIFAGWSEERLRLLIQQQKQLNGKKDGEKQEQEEEEEEERKEGQVREGETEEEEKHEEQKEEKQEKEKDLNDDKLQNKLDGYSVDETAFIKAHSLKKIFTQSIAKIKEIKAAAKTILPQNALFVEEFFSYKVDDSTKEIIQTEQNDESDSQLMDALAKGFNYLLGCSKKKKPQQQTDGLEGEEGEQETLKESEEIVKELDNADEQIPKTAEIPEQKQKKSNIVILIPQTIPASGKTTFFQKLMEVYQKSNAGFKVHYLSSDQVRKQLMDERKAQNKNLNDDDLFNKTAKAAKDRFESLLRSMIEEIDEEEKKGDHLIILDKNHPPQAVTSTIPFLQSIMPKKVNYKLIAILPKVCSTYSSEKGAYPFSLTYLLNCLSRCLNRDTHETLLGDPYKLTGVVFMFFSLFKNISFTPAAIQRNGFNQKIEVGFHAEDANSETLIKPKLLKSLEQVLKNFYAASDPAESPYISGFLEQFYNQNMEFKPVEFEQQFEQFEPQLKAVFKSFN